MTESLTAQRHESGTDSYALPQRSRLHGPVSTRRQRRTLTAYAVLALFGFLPSVFGLGTGWRAFGLGLVLPGGGFLLHGQWGVGAWLLTLAVFAISLVLWFGTGNIIAPIAVWLVGAGVAAGWSAGDPRPGNLPAAAVAGIVALCAMLAALLKRRAVLKARRQRTEREAYLPTEVAAFSERRVPDAVGVGELDERQLSHVRWLLDLGLQPVGDYKGFDIIEQFQPSALRYQINHAQYALAQVQRHYVPNFHGYMSRAQENLIEKLAEPKVWGYWRLERLWGRLSLRYDPAASENIMFTGWSGICLNTYSATTGSKRFAGTEALEFRLGNSKQKYRHGAASFNRSLLENFERADHTLFPCEPNWTYGACNFYGINSVASYDAAFGTNYLPALREPFLRGLREEFMNPAGDLVPFRSDHLGFGPPASTGATLAQAAGWVRPIYPQLAETVWAVLCREVLQLEGGGLVRYLEKPMMADPGNYRNTGLWCRAMLAFAAVELGDMDVANAAFEAIERLNQPVEKDGSRNYAIGSTFGNTIAAHALVNRPGDWSALITQPVSPTTLSGPVLVDVQYDEAMVARAVSDGHDLELILHPAPRAMLESDTALLVERLQAGRTYRVTTPGRVFDINADQTGSARMTVHISGRTPVHVQPV